MIRGTVVIDRERCKGCHLCLAVCPQHVLALDVADNSHGYRPVHLAEGSARCTGCGVCAVVCPDVAITVYRQSPRRSMPAGAAA